MATRMKGRVRLLYEPALAAEKESSRALDRAETRYE